MALTREQVASYAGDEFAQLLTDAGLTAIAEGDLKTTLDRTFRLLGITTAEVPTDREADFLLVFDWAMLSRIERAIAGRVDLTVDGPNQSKRYSQAVTQVRQLKDDAWRWAQPLVQQSEEADDWDVGTISLGIVAYPPEGAW